MAKLDLKDIIIAMRVKGASYKEIVDKTGCSGEYARKVWSKASCQSVRAKKPAETCKCCGKELKQTPGAKPKIFCDKKCCSDYHNEKKKHKPYVRICEFCNKEFVSYGYPKKRFCGRDCQTEAAREKKHESAA